MKKEWVNPTINILGLSDTKDDEMSILGNGNGGIGNPDNPGQGNQQGNGNTDNNGNHNGWLS